MDTTPNKAQITYTGLIQPRPGQVDDNGHPLLPYLPDKELVEAVNLALFLKRPLLIKGEPGCGKTCLARAVAFELGLPYFSWHIKSTSRARDGLYTYDAVGRLRDAQLAATGRFSSKEFDHFEDPAHYVHWGPLGLAFQCEQRSVMLIDEIDKADMDFPNDLLLELDEQRFVVEEIGRTIRAKQPPIIFFTSNDEKDLPDAFLRRCLFHYIKFPAQERLLEIVKIHFQETSDDLAFQAVKRFQILRRRMEEDKGEIGKKVSTSELLDWFRVLNSYPLDEALIKVQGKLPLCILLKSWEDHRRYLEGTDADSRPNDAGV